MSDRALARAGRTVALVGAAASVASMVLAVATAEVAFFWRSFAGTQATIALAFAVVVWLVIPNQPRNVTVWAMACSVGSGIFAFAVALLPVLIDGDPSVVLRADWVPADSPSAVGWVQVVANAFSIPGLFVPLTVGLMVFPDGRLPSSRWHPIAATAVAAIAVLAVTHGWWYRPSNASRSEGPLIIGSGLVCVLVTLVATVGLVVRFRRSSGLRRLQHKWIVSGTCIAAGVFAGFFFLPDTAYDEPAAALVAAVGAAAWVVSYGVAVGRYRLYDIDLVISRSLAFVSLAGLITAVYVLVVVVVGSFVGGPDLWLSVLATALVAVAFEPARGRLQRLANRLVYGQRSTPYEVLGDLTRRLAVAESSEALLERLAGQLCSATSACRVVVWLDDEGELRPTAVAPGSAPRPEPLSAQATLPGRNFPIEHEGVALGRLTLDERPGTSLRPSEERLARDLAASAAPVVRKVRLDRALATKAAEIDESRRRLARAEDDELRRLEHDLGDRVERQVAALMADVGLAEHIAQREDAQRVAMLLARLGEETRAAVDQIRAVARGIHPSLLDADGLERAIPLLAANCPCEVQIATELRSRQPAALERAVYFCVSEALTNATKHALGPISVRVAEQDDRLTFTVTDSGPGFDVDLAPVGSGLHNMRERLDALAGVLTVRSRPGAFTVVSGVLPIPRRSDGLAGADQRSADHAATISSGPNADFDRNAVAPAASACCSYSS